MNSTLASNNPINHYYHNITPHRFVHSDMTTFTERAPTHQLMGRMGSIASSISPINIVDGDRMIQKWLIRVPVGEKLGLQWSGLLKEEAQLGVRVRKV